MSDSTVSRRSFLKAIGATSIAATASTVAIPSTVSAAALADSEDYGNAIAIANASPVFQQVTSELSVQDLRFDLAQSSFLRNENAPGTVGLALNQTKRMSLTIGGAVVPTIDLNSKSVTMVHFTVGRTVGDGHELQRVDLHLPSGHRAEVTSQLPVDFFHQGLFQKSQAVLPSGEIAQIIIEPHVGSAATTIGGAGRRYTTQSCDYGQWNEYHEYFFGCCGTTFCCCPSPLWCGNACTCGDWIELVRTCTRDTSCNVSCTQWTTNRHIQQPIPCC